MLKQLNIAQKGLIVILVLLASELVFVTFLAMELAEVRASLEREHHNREVLERLSEFTYISQRAGESMIQTSMVGKEAQEVIGVGDYEKHVKLLNKALKSLDGLLKDDADGAKLLSRLEMNCIEIAPSFERSMDPMLTPPKKRSYLKRFQDSIRKTKIDADALIDRYSTTDRSSKTLESLEQVERSLMVFLIASFLGNLLAALIFFNRVAGRIFVVTDNIARFSAHQPLHPSMKGSDEIVQIDALLHNLASDLNNAAEQEQNMIEYASDVVCSIDTRGNFLEVSPASTEQWGYKPEDLIGQDVETLLGGNKIISYFQSSNLSLGQESHFVIEEQLKHADGHRVDTLWSMHWSPSDGYLFCCVRDITEAKRADRLLAAQEQEVRNAIENMPMGILTVDSNSKLMSANATARNMFGISIQDLRSQSFKELLFPVDEGAGSSAFGTVDSGSSAPVRCSFKSPDGSTHYADVTFTMSEVNNDDTLLVLIEDVTERWKLESLKRDFVSLLGEQLRTPLDTVHKLITDLVRKKVFDEKRQLRLERIDLNVSRLLRLIAELLKVEQLGEGKLVGKMAPTAVTDVLSEAVEAVKDFSEQQKIELQWKSKDYLVRADVERLVQVIINLITNAIKYSPAGTTVSLSVADHANQVEIQVADQGRGVPPHMKESIFEPFVQTAASDAKRGSGTGLGLSICKRIIEAHDGTIGVDSEEGKGSVFWVRLPHAGGSSGA